MAALLAMVMMLSAGAGAALLCIFVPDFARFFLQVSRADMETRQYAESLFLSRQLFATRERRAVLILVSLFERRMVVLPDTGLANQLHQEAMDMISRHMRLYLKEGQAARALEAGLEKLEDLVTCDNPSTLTGNELPDRIIEEKGA